MLRRISRILVLAIEAALPFHARPPASLRRPRPGSMGGSKMKRSIVVLLAVLFAAGPAGAGGFGAGGNAGSAPDLDLAGVGAVQQHRARAERAPTERDCEARYRSFASRTAFRPSERRRQLAACLDLVAAGGSARVAQHEE
jgi:hypothetical protein